MIKLREGEKRSIKAKVVRVTGEGTITLTSPERRVLNSSRVGVTGYDIWAVATWDSVNAELVFLFDTTVAALSGVGRYYVQLRGVIGNERYAAEILVEVLEWGP